MFKILLKTACRNIWKTKFYNGISLLGLSLGLTVAIFIAIWIDSELSFNQVSDNSENIYRVSSIIGDGDSKQTWGGSVGPVAYFAKKKVPEVKNAARVRDNYSYRIYSTEDKDLEAGSSAYVDPEFFNLFDTEFLYGDKSKPFSGNNSVVLTETAANKYFGSTDILGKTITGDNEDRYAIVGVIKDLSQNSSIDFDFFFPVSMLESGYSDNPYWDSIDSDWGNFNYVTYLELAENASSEKVIEKLTRINKDNDPNKELTSTKAAYYLQPIKKMNLYGYNGDPTNIKTVRIFGLVLILILAIACINYVNLNTARAIQRAKEVSLRKLIGAERKHLFLQFIIESCMFFIIALALSIALIFILVPSFNTISGKEISFNILDIGLWKLIFTVFAATLAASSIYPAILLSSFKPLEAIKGNIAPGIGAVNFRKVLVCIQFMFSVILIICTIVIGNQLDYLNTMNPGYDRAQVLSFAMTDAMIEHREAVENQIKNLPGIQDVSFSNNNLINNGWTTGDTNWEGKNPQSSFIVAPLGVDEEFLPMLKMELLEGQNFTGIASDSSNYILNETAVEKMGLKDPVGKSFELWETRGTIIGVVKDFNFESLKQKIEPAVLFYDPEPYMMYIKTATGDVSESITGLEKVWSSYNEGYPFNFSFLDERYEQMYRDDIRTGKLFRIFSILAIFVSCLGLFGLTTYSAHLKKREIGIRKVLGASILQISKLLSKDFMKLVFISSIAAIPLAWYLMHFWLQNFIYRTTMSWWIFAASGVSILTIALITVSLQSIRAAMANPVENIKTD
ncbi:ABC transporter permease [Salegentibacter mishustinae]|uniref:ABC transporter permease n=1 Tax=Salegentibacter mishustinae TaxID=270918 RepID=UPI00249264AA|nr:ABC transporter permease [Salegentibacter mishustinae]